MSGEATFEKYVKRLPGVDWKTLLSWGVSWFVNKQNPEEVEFVEYPNGWALEVQTDGDGIKQAREFWENHLEEKL